MTEKKKISGRRRLGWAYDSPSHGHQKLDGEPLGSQANGFCSKMWEWPGPGI